MTAEETEGVIVSFFAYNGTMNVRKTLVAAPILLVQETPEWPYQVTKVTNASMFVGIITLE